ncbi:MAG: hypothetical protein GY853_03325 [PVC group bacterium]|nr:hypothetical protein [PVC group bacterium]
MLARKQRCDIVICFFICSLLISGCASSKALKRTDGAQLRIDKKHYLKLTDVCSEHGVSWQWDGFSDIVIVKKLNREIRLYPGSSLILHNGQIQDMYMPVQISKGLILVPISFLNLVADGPKDFIDQEKEYTLGIERVVIDPGHGGKDPGASSNGIQEKNIALDVAQRLKQELVKQGIQVIMTRDTDVFIPLHERAEIANRAKADFFISIHVNASTSSTPHGFEAFYLSDKYDNFSKAVQIRENAVVKLEKGSEHKYTTDLNATLWDMILAENRIESIEMAYAISEKMERMLHLKTRYIKGANFYVLKGTCVPAVLLEIGYLTNGTEGARLNNVYYRQMIAETIAAGIVGYKERFELTNGFSR